jgi:hypothetical protein
MSLLFSLEEESEWICNQNARVGVRLALLSDDNWQPTEKQPAMWSTLMITVESALATICLSDGNSDHF